MLDLLVIKLWPTNLNLYALLKYYKMTKKTRQVRYYLNFNLLNLSGLRYLALSMRARKQNMQELKNKKKKHFLI